MSIESKIAEIFLKHNEEISSEFTTSEALKMSRILSVSFTSLRRFLISAMQRLNIWSKARACEVCRSLSRFERAPGKSTK